MENLDGVSVAVTLAVGGLIGMIATRFMSPSSDVSTQEPDVKVDAPKKVDVTKKKKKKTSASKKAEEKARVEAELLVQQQKELAEKELAEKKLAEKKAAEKKAAEKELEASKKSKKKKKKVESKTPVVPVTAAVAKVVQAPIAIVEEESSWEVVPTKKKKTKTASADVADGDDKTSTCIDVSDCVAVLVGPAGARINSIQEQSGAQLNLDKGTSLCTINGTVDQVELARKLVFDIVGNQGKEAVETGAMRVLVFGPGGATIRKIQEDSGARLDMGKDSSMVTITGDLNSVRAAKSMIEIILKSSNVASMVLDDREISSVIGKGGENIRRLTAESGATVDIGSDKMCSISGTPEQVMKARELVKLYIEHRGPPPAATETLTIPIDHGRLLIGKKGATINEFQTRTRTRLSVEHTMAMSTVVVSGEKIDVSRCVEEIYKLIEDNSYKEVIDLPTTNLVKVILGVKGETINSIRDETNARLEIADDSSSVSILGTRAQVTKAVALVKRKIADELGPPPVKTGNHQHAIELGSATGKIIGTAGSNIARLEKEFGVTVVIKNGTMCYVTGKPANADSAKKDIDGVLLKHEELIEKAKKQEEALQQAVQSEGYSGWDVPVETGAWDAVTSDSQWNIAPTTNGW